MDVCLRTPPDHEPGRLSSRVDLQVQRITAPSRHAALFGGWPRTLCGPWMSVAAPSIAVAVRESVSDEPEMKMEHRAMFCGGPLGEGVLTSTVVLDAKFESTGAGTSAHHQSLGCPVRD